MRKRAGRVLDLVIVMGILMILVSFLHTYTGLQTYDMNRNPDSMMHGWVSELPEGAEDEELIDEGPRGVRIQSLHLKRYPVGLAYGIKGKIFKKYTPLMVRCTDTDDRNDIYRKGFVRLYDDPQNQRHSKIYVDYCENFRILVQYDCDHVRGVAKIGAKGNCPRGCDEGICQPIIPFVGSEPYAVGRDGIRPPPYAPTPRPTLSGPYQPVDYTFSGTRLDKYVHRHRYGYDPAGGKFPLEIKEVKGVEGVATYGPEGEELREGTGGTDRTNTVSDAGDSSFAEDFLGSAFDDTEDEIEEEEEIDESDEEEPDGNVFDDEVSDDEFFDDGEDDGELEDDLDDEDEEYDEEE